jgi:DNA polymerase I-like protein with 3'-5' exonuclease and polymerase domains
VNTEYWSKGIDTPDIPFSILDEYLRQDLRITEEMYLKQVDWLEQNPKHKRLVSLQCQDLLVLQEMEWNGLLYDTKKSKERNTEIDNRIIDLTGTLDGLVDGIPVNWNSPDNVSAVLYGGTINQPIKEPFLFTYKNPEREPVWKERWITKTHVMPRLVEPLPNSSLQKEGMWQTGTPVLKEIQAKTKKAKDIITSLLQLAELSKLNDYYKGLPKLIEEMEWGDHIIHGTLNQCNVVTGRLSSNKPNLQNLPEEVHELIGSRFG